MSKTEDDSYMKYKVYERNDIFSIKTKNEVNQTIETIESLFRELEEYVRACALTTDNKKLGMMDGFAERLVKLADEVTLAMRAFNEGYTSESRPSRSSVGGVTGTGCRRKSRVGYQSGRTMEKLGSTGQTHGSIPPQKIVYARVQLFFFPFLLL